MAKEYLVIRSGIGKKTGSPYSACSPIVNITDCSFLGSEVVYLQEIVPVGEKVEIEQMVSVK